jgi:hypothetical protein
LNPGRRGGKPATIIFYLVCEAIGTAVTPGLLCQASGDNEDDYGEADGKWPQYPKQAGTILRDDSNNYFFLSFLWFL